MIRRRPGRRTVRPALVTAAVTAAALPLSAHAAPGDPVPSFGGDGVVTVAEGRPPTFDLAADAVRMGDGSLVLVGTAFSGQVGDIVLARVDADRDLVDTFGSGGRLRISLPDESAVATAAARHGSGVVVVGMAQDPDSFTERVVVLKVTSAGRLDTSFAGDGIRFLDLGDEVDHRTVAVGSGGRIAIGGFADGAAQVVMLTSTGALDTSFSADGILPLPSIVPGSDVLPVAFQPDGKLVVTGATTSVTNVVNTWVGRFTTSGAADVTFDLDGVRVVDVGLVEDRPRAVVVASNRVYVLVRAGTDVGLLALRSVSVPLGPAAGAPDTGFSADGQVVIATGGTSSDPVDVAVAPSGALQVASTVTLGGGSKGWELTETSSDGVPNTAFLGSGRIIAVRDGEGGPVAVSTDGTTASMVGEESGDMSVVDVALVGPVSTVGHVVNLARQVSAVEFADSVVAADGGVVSFGTVRTGPGRTAAVLVGVRADGRRDLSYGVDGAAQVVHPGGSATGLALAPRGAGGVVALVGTRDSSSSGYVVHARTAAGRPDRDFGVSGRRVLPFSSDVEAPTSGALTRDARGRTVVAVTTTGVGGGVWGTAIVRLTPDGALDPGFGVAGVVQVGAAEPLLTVHVEVRPDGRIVVVDSSRVIRLRADGSFDGSFDGDGVLSPIPGLSSRASGADVQPDGRVVVAAVEDSRRSEVHRSSDGAVAVVRLTPSGALDPTFGGGATVTIPTEELFAEGLYDLVVQRDGRIGLLVFARASASTAAPAVIRLRVDGSIDATFGTDGRRVIPTDATEAVGRDLDVTRDGDLFVSGSLYDPTAFGLLARLDGGPTVRCDGRAVTAFLITGERPTARADVVLGTPGRDSVSAGRGDDVVCGLGGDDELRGGRGADVLLGGSGSDRLEGGAGTDRCVGGPGTDVAVSCERVRSVP